MIRILWFILLVATALVVVKCAHPLTPTGGAKDVTPPVILEAIPEDGSANFATNKFIIKFDEYVSLDDIQQKALISPPMKEMPEFTIKGKSVQVKFKEELKPNTTYSVYFGDAIIDITEGNPITNYTYIFSTGEYVDSLSLSGYVDNALDLMPLEGVYVMLYKDNNDTIVFDSLPYYVVPYYLSKTDDVGRFQFNGLANDDYLLFAINDQNSNYIFDQPGEQIAFLDSLIQPIYIEKPKIDSTNTDSISNTSISVDSTIATTDTLRSDSVNYNNIDSVNLYMFLSPDTIQRIFKAEVIASNTIRFSFSQSAKNVKFESLKYSLDSITFVVDYSKEKDTLYWYLNNPPIDSLELLITQFNDTLGTVYLKLDIDKKSNRVKKKEKKKEKLGWKSNIAGNKLNLNKQLEIKFSQPFVRLNNVDSLLLIIGNDTIWSPEFSFIDSLQMKILFPYELLESTKYMVHFPDSSFSSWNNIHTEVIDINFSTLSLSDYGIFTANLFPENKQNHILQLLTEEKEEIIKEFNFIGDTTITISYIKPAKYKLKIIYDDNNNHRWDVGDYGLKKQPEKVIYFTKEINIRANWEIEEDWGF